MRNALIVEDYALNAHLQNEFIGLDADALNLFERLLSMTSGVTICHSVIGGGSRTMSTRQENWSFRPSSL